MCSSVPSEVRYPADASLDLPPWVVYSRDFLGKPMGSLIPLGTFFYFQPLERYFVLPPPPLNIFISDLFPV